MQNHLKTETSPYLRQHMGNPVDWYPWGEEAFHRAKREDKPVFLSIGYSTCHWCHVMAHESFEEEQIAEYLNEHFISIKVDKEERPDIDSIYMSVCQALTGSGGWPMTIFMTPDQKPFFAGTYFPRNTKYGKIGFEELIKTVSQKWQTNRDSLMDSAEEIVEFVVRNHEKEDDSADQLESDYDFSLILKAVTLFHRSFDKKYGGFGDAPKFPSPHNLLFLMRHFERSKEAETMQMVETTLLQMYRGGIFDHIGGGFSRYSTDRYFLAPHFEKMLYDNALLILAYCKAYELTKNVLYRGVAERTANYIIREMASPEGGFYSAQDADSEGVEGKYYLFEPLEVMQVLGQKEGKEFCTYFDITREGNFEGKSIPNLLKNNHISARYNVFIPQLYEYRKKRYHLHLDNKILTSWNGLMIAAMCHLYRITKNEQYLSVVKKAQEYVEKNFGRFLDDYANDIYALLALYEASLDKAYLDKAQRYCEKAVANFYDEKNGGFFLYGREDEQLFLRPKETYDGAMPSGNSMMTYNLVRLYYLTEKNVYKELLNQQMCFMKNAAKQYPAGYAMFLLALEDSLELPDKVTIVVKEMGDLNGLSCRIPLHSVVRILDTPTEEYPLKNDRTTFYVCKGQVCYPPTNELQL